MQKVTEQNSQVERTTLRHRQNIPYLLELLSGAYDSKFNASPMDTVGRVIDQRQDFFEHLKRVIDWANKALEDGGYTTRFSMKHEPDVRKDVNHIGLNFGNRGDIRQSVKDRQGKKQPEGKRIKRLSPQSVVVYLHADPDLVDFMNIDVVGGINKKPNVDYEVFKDSYCICAKTREPIIHKDKDGIPLLMAPVARINLSAADRPRNQQIGDPCEFFYQNPTIVKGNEDQGYSVIRTGYETLISHLFSYLPVYDVEHLDHEGNVIKIENVSEQWEVEKFAKIVLDELKAQRAKKQNQEELAKDQTMLGNRLVEDFRKNLVTTVPVDWKQDLPPLNKLAL